MGYKARNIRTFIGAKDMMNLEHSIESLVLKKSF